MQIVLIQQLYRQIPAVQCVNGCSKCCGLVPWAAVEYDQIKIKLPARGIHCPYLTDCKCSIYDQRPFMCRIFGAVARPHLLACPYGAMPVFPLLPDQASELVRKYQFIIKDDFTLGI